VFAVAVTFLAVEQRMNTILTLGKTPVETYKILQEALSRSSVSEWFKPFKDGREDLQDNPRSGRPSASQNADTIVNVREMMTRDHQWALKMMANGSNISKEMTRQILREDVRKKMCAKFVPHRLTSCQGFIQTCQDSPNILACIFLFPKVRTALKGEGFQDAEDIKTNVTVEMNAVPFEAFADCFQKILNDSKIIFNLAEITFIGNITIFYFILIFAPFFTPVRELYCQTTQLLIIPPFE
jgi:transposase